MKKSYLTVTDQFCGAGGSSIGAVAAGAELRMAMNHWPLAIETHNSNFPDAAHDCADMSAVNPRRYPSTDILITSPECTNHSLAKGKKRKTPPQLSMFGKAEIDPAEERSRATMWDVPHVSPSLAHPGQTPAVEDCGFRMLQPHEIQKAMAFPTDYKVLGTQREKVKQLGNAVTPPVMSMLMQRCVESLL